MDALIEALVWLVIGLVKLTMALTMLMILVVPVMVATPFIFLWPRSDRNEPFARTVARRYLEVLGACSFGFAADWFS